MVELLLKYPGDDVNVGNHMVIYARTRYILTLIMLYFTPYQYLHHILTYDTKSAHLTSRITNRFSDGIFCSRVVQDRYVEILFIVFLFLRC